MAGLSTLRDGNVVNCMEKAQKKFKFRSSYVKVESMKEGKDEEDEIEVLRGLFDRNLIVLLRDAKNVIRPIPALLGAGRPVDLFRLFYMVRERGGFDSVSREKLWGLIAESLDFDFRFSAALKLIYFKYLDELDQCLNKMGKDGNLVNKGSDLELLSIELEKRFLGLHEDGIKLTKIDNGVISLSAGCGKNSGGVQALMHDLAISGVKKDNKLADDASLANCDDDEKLSKIEGDSSEGKSGQGSYGRQTINCKRKRDWQEMLSWLKQVAKKPRDLSNGRIPNNSSWWNKNGGKKSKELAVLAREEMLKRRYADLKDVDGCPSFQKKQKINPSIYNDPSSSHVESVRCSKRVPALAKSPKCSCCGPSSTKENRLLNHCKVVQPKNDSKKHKKEKTPPDQPIPKPNEPTDDGSSPDKKPVEKQVNVGPQFQAEIPPWTGEVPKNDCDQVGTRVWPPEKNQEGTILLDIYSVLGKGRNGFCDCPFPGSVECVRFHTAENKMKLKHELGRAFYQWRFDRMGEVISLSWTPQDEEKFKKVVSTTRLVMGKSYFPKKTRKEFMDYYFNVFLQRKRSYQNRVTPNVVDSDDELTEFGSVGGLYGHAACNASIPSPCKCILNEQCWDADMTISMKKR